MPKLRQVVSGTWRKFRPSGGATDEAASSPVQSDIGTSSPPNGSTPAETAPTPPLSATDSPADCSGADDSTLVLPQTPSAMPELNAGVERDLLSHFIATTASHLVRSSSSATNPYLKYLLPLAFFDRSVMDAILSLSASQQESRHMVSTETTLRYQTKATKRLRSLLGSDEQRSSIVTLATSLVLCMTELYAGSTDAWKQYLRGAKHIIEFSKKADTGIQKGGEMRFLMSLYCFLDSATTISTCRPPLTDRFKDDETADEDSLQIYGIPQSLFHLLDRVNSLAYQRRTRVDDDSERAFRYSAQSVADAIDVQIDFGDLLDDAHSTEASHASSAFKWAMRLRLAQVVEGYDATNPAIVGSVHHILQEVDQVPEASPSQATLLFPLIMAAGACLQDEHRAVIRTRLKSMKAQHGFGRIAAAQELAERVWLYRDLEPFSSSGLPVNWAHVRYYEMHGLAVF
ncbi:hypothetical protein PRZ48_012694 [Zasmidium cellare]|uniref:Uncharacterized protein n=1 Tax=Zasmidium cellare TaxID=395010 RepID=A0ABR0E5L2_ZASCE|nr:hypothetical protein PRZ48_012694 [Zasmidium cellare]